MMLETDVEPTHDSTTSPLRSGHVVVRSIVGGAVTSASPRGGPTARQLLTESPRDGIGETLERTPAAGQDSRVTSTADLSVRNP